MQARMRRVFLSITFAFLVLNLPGALALGASPARVMLNYEPGKIFESGVCFEISSINRLRVQAAGVLEKNIKIEGLDENGEFDASKNPCLKYTVTVPMHFEKPGMQYSIISATEVPEETYGNIFAVVKIVHQVFIFVPYPWKYLEISGFTVNNVNAGEQVPITISFINRGNETVKSVVGKIKIYDHTGAEVGNATSDSAQNIESGQGGTLKAKWNSKGRKEGNYFANLTLEYDGLSTNSSVPFKLGGLDVNLIDYTNNVTFGGIKPFGLLVDSLWSEPVSVKATVQVFNYSRKPGALLSFETLTKSAAPWSSVVLPGYVDTDALGIGEFDLIINISFEGESKAYQKKFSVIEPQKKEEPKAQGQGIFSSRNILMGMIVLLVIILVVILFLFMPGKKKGQDKDAHVPPTDGKEKHSGP